MNKYIIPVCNIPKSKVYNLIVSARTYEDCQDKIMSKFNSDFDSYQEFVNAMDNQDILIGEITDIEEL